MPSGLKMIRAAMACLILTAISFFFLDTSGLTPLQCHGLLHLQLVPILLGGGLLGLGVWLVLSLLFGRIYCSVICPLGIFQDVITRIGTVFNSAGNKSRPSKKRSFMQRAYRYSKPFVRLRYGFLLFFIISLFLSFGIRFPLFVSLLDPYGIFGRMITSLVRPFYLLGNNILTPYFHVAGNYSVTYRPVFFNPGISVVALVMFVLLFGLAFRHGRRYCNTICPVGTFLGWVARYSFFRIRLHSDCIGCGLCEFQCKSECIDSKNKTIDTSRCVVCFNCLTACSRNSLSYTCLPKNRVKAEKIRNLPQQSNADFVTFNQRQRRFLLSAFLSSFFMPLFFRKNEQATVVAAEDFTTVPQVLPQGKSVVSYQRENAIFPPGGISLRHFQSRCTACQLCVAKCPAQIIFPASNEYGWGGFMQPTLRFTHGFCNFDCTICADVCPNRALHNLSVQEKHQTQIGIVHFLVDNCVVNTQNSNCGACAEHCPTGAVSMVPFGDPSKHLTIPTIKTKLCVGCGACEYICPIRPYRAIYIEGNRVHQTAELPYDPDAKQQTLQMDDFGF